MVCSGNMVDLKILQSDWLRSFWPISQGQKFSQTWDLCRNAAANDINFHYRTKSEKTDDKSFQWILKTLVLAYFWSIFQIFWAKKLFRKIWLCHAQFHSTMVSSTMPKLRKKPNNSIKRLDSHSQTDSISEDPNGYRRGSNITSLASLLTSGLKIIFHWEVWLLIFLRSSFSSLAGAFTSWVTEDKNVSSANSLMLIDINDRSL